MFDGFTRVSIGGKERPLKFGVNQTSLFCGLRNLTPKEYFIFLKDKLNSGDGSELRDLIWSALKDGGRYVNEDFNYQPEDVGDWLDNPSPDSIKKIMDAFSNSLPKPNRQQKRQTSKKKVKT